MVDEDVKVNGVAVVVGGREGAEAAGEGGEAVVGYDFEGEGERGSGGLRREEVGGWGRERKGRRERVVREEEKCE